MDQQKFDTVIAQITTGMTPTRACLEAITTIVHLMNWLDQHPNGKTLHAAMLQAEGDARIEKSDQLHNAMITRINDGLVRTPQIASVEQTEITRLRKEGFMLRARAEKMLPKLPVEKQRSGTSWLDTKLKQRKAVTSTETTAHIVGQHFAELNAVGIE
ncbi:MAG: hypothetical protein V3V15_07185 [Sphingorhabdus sp.]